VKHPFRAYEEMSIIGQPLGALQKLLLKCLLAMERDLSAAQGGLACASWFVFKVRKDGVFLDRVSPAVEISCQIF
jgi:hypothetical protein